MARALAELKKRLHQRWLDENRPDLDDMKDPRVESLEQDRMQEKYGSEQSDESCQNCGICDGVYEIQLFNKWGDEHTYFFCGDGCEGQWMRENKMSYAAEEYGSESFKPPQSAINNAKRGLELRKKWGRGGLSPSEAKSHGIDSGVTRARKIASGKVSTHDVRRMSEFNRHRKNYRPEKKMPDGGPTAGTIAWLLWGGTSGVNWAKKKSAAMNAEEVSMTDWENWEGDLPERYPHRQPRKSGRGTEPIAGPDRKAYGEEKRRRLKARSPTLTVTKVEPNKKIPTMNDITFENGMVAGYPKTKDAKVGDRFVVSTFDGSFPKIMDAEDYGVGEVWMSEDSYDEVRELGCPICSHSLKTVSASAECPICEVLWHYHQDDGFSYFEAEGDFGDGEPVISYWEPTKNNPYRLSEAYISVDFEGRRFGGKISEFDEEGNQVFDAVEFDDWADQEMMTHGKDVSFQEWADEEGEKHGDMNLVDWAKDEEKSHDKRYEAEEFCSECGCSHGEVSEELGAEEFGAETSSGTQVFNSCWKCGSGLHLYQIIRYPATPGQIAGVGGDPSEAKVKDKEE